MHVQMTRALPQCPFPSLIFDDSLRVSENPPAETRVQHYEPRSPCRNGYLESIFCPIPKNLEGPDHFVPCKGSQVWETKKNSDQRNLVNQDTLGDSRIMTRINMLLRIL